ncbi:MAG: hypothetical protein HY432_01960 [Candidatus Liptonbacteria bacterium]|nr:hypothetical protein [Candidatus Liptonbacteria bacterium]
MKKYFPFLALALFASASTLVIGQALAQEDRISFPVAELGNCGDKQECKTYCDEPANAGACLDFAEKNNLMSREEAAMARKMISGSIKGPGGCTTKDKCETYCNDINNIEECVAFAEQNNIMPAQELAEARKIASAIKRGVKPPACRNKADCDNYCGAPEHMEECMNFALEAGFMSEEERADAQKMLTAIKSGVKPPACRGKEECDAYCSQDANIQECADFAVAAGFITQKEYEMMKRTGGRGPGGCKGREECEAFCNNSDNREACFQFGKKHGLISEEELKKMEEGTRMFMENLNNAPPQVKECLAAAFGDLSNVQPSEEIGQKMRECFEKVGPSMMGGQSGSSGVPMGVPPQGFSGGATGQFTGPGGCTTPEECKTYCMAHPAECGIPAGGGFYPPPPNMIGVPPPGDYPMSPLSSGTYQTYPSPDAYQMPPSSGTYQMLPPPDGYQTSSYPGDYQAPPPSAATSTPTSLISPDLLLGIILNWWRVF